MKRRKKLWIAFAALAVVVALCAIALLYRPVPFDFLRGARLREIKTYTDGSAHYVRVTYFVPRITARVAAEARPELRPELGWASSDAGWYVAFVNAKRDESVHIEALDPVMQDRIAVYVSVTRPAHLFDRIRAWLGGDTEDLHRAS